MYDYRNITWEATAATGGEERRDKRGIKRRKRHDA